MKVTIITNIELSEEALDEVEELGVQLDVRDTKLLLPAKWNPYFKSNWGNFDWIRDLFSGIETDVRAFVTSRTLLRDAEIKGHIGMYDMADGDTKHDLYIGLPNSLDKRAQANGFRTNLAYLICHEITHGEEKMKGGPDRTHSMVDQGDLLSLWEEHQERRNLQQKSVNLLETIVGLLTALLANKGSTRLIHPVKDYAKLISQDYGVPNSDWYPASGHHIGTDYACPEGTPVVAPFDGEVIASGYSDALGNYCHYQYTYLKEVYVVRMMHLIKAPRQGKYRQGIILGRTGATGKVTGPHLHLDVWYSEVRLDLINKKNWDQLTVDPSNHYK